MPLFQNFSTAKNPSHCSCDEALIGVNRAEYPRRSRRPNGLLIALMALLSIFAACNSHNAPNESSVPATSSESDFSERSELDRQAKRLEEEEHRKAEALRKQHDAESIKSVMQQNDTLEAELSQAIDNLRGDDAQKIDQWVPLVNDYVARARGIKTDSCPGDFAEAFYRHLTAWSVLADSVSAHPAVLTDDQAFVDGFLRGLNGDLTGGAVQRKNEDERWLANVQSKGAEVKRTRGEMEALSIRYSHLASDETVRSASVP